MPSSTVTTTTAAATRARRTGTAPAYPPEAGVRRWQRTLRLERGGTGGSSEARVILEDAYDLDQSPASLALHLMTSGAVDASEPGVLRCATPTRPLLVRYDARSFTVAVEEIPVDDARLRPVWGDRLYRATLTASRPAAHGTWHLEMTAE